MEKQIFLKKHGAGGFQFFLVEKKGNCRLKKEKQKAIIKALFSSTTEGVYKRIDGKIIRQLLNGSCQFLLLDKELNEYLFV